MAAVVIEITLDLVIATSFSRVSVLVDSSTVVSLSDEVRRFSFLKLSDFSNRLARLESDLFLVRCEVIANFDDCLFSELTPDAFVEFDGCLRASALSRFILEVSLLSVDLSGLSFVEDVLFRLDDSLLIAVVLFVGNDVFLRLLVVSFFGSVVVFFVLVVGLIATLLLLFGVFLIDNLSWSFSSEGFVVGLLGGFGGVSLFFWLELRTLEFREKLVLLPDLERLLPVGGLRELPGLGSRDAGRDIVLRRDVLLLRAVAPESRRGSRLVEVAERTGILVGDVSGVRTRSLSLAKNVVPKLSSWPDCSESLFGVPMIGDSVVGLDIRLFDRDTLVDIEPPATIPRSITEDGATGAPALESRRPGEIELRLRPRTGSVSRLDAMLFLRGILD